MTFAAAIESRLGSVDDAGSMLLSARINGPRSIRYQQRPTVGKPKQTAIIINWVILDSDWKAKIESHPRVRTPVKNLTLGLEVPYLLGSEPRRSRPDFIVLVDDGHSLAHRCVARLVVHLVVEIKSCRGEDAKVKKSTMEAYWTPGVNNLGAYGRWAFAELRDVYRIETNFNVKVDSTVNEMVYILTREPTRSTS